MVQQAEIYGSKVVSQHRSVCTEILVTLLTALFRRTKVADVTNQNGQNRSRTFLTAFARLSKPQNGSRRLLTGFILLLAVWMFVPYQFAYVVGFLVHTNTCIKSLRPQSQQVRIIYYHITSLANFALT